MRESKAITTRVLLINDVSLTSSVHVTSSSKVEFVLCTTYTCTAADYESLAVFMYVLY